MNLFSALRIYIAVAAHLLTLRITVWRVLVIILALQSGKNRPIVENDKNPNQRKQEH